MRLVFVSLIMLLFFSCSSLFAQSKAYWHDRERELRYTPQGDDFVIVNGDKKFNRALYGTNSAFRIETGDIPEFGFFMPNMGGNLQLGLISDNGSLWLNDAEYIKSIYRAGARIYEIKDPFTDNGIIEISVLAMRDSEGMIMQIKGESLPDGISLLCMYGGASNKRFSRNGDLGVDNPACFALNQEACLGNIFVITDNAFILNYGQSSKGTLTNSGLFPDNAELKTGSPYNISSPSELWKSYVKDNKPVLLAKIPLRQSQTYYVSIKKDDNRNLAYSDLKDCFNEAEEKRLEIASTVKIATPDPFINPLGGVLSIAADGIWDDCWLHGAIGWRMPLSGWRAAYTGDAIGWHERSRKHFDSYAASQVKDVEPVISHPTQDSTFNLARAAKIWGTQMYSNGYICRNPYDSKKMHHYDMNLCYIDELLWHFNWTGDIGYARQMWPLLISHLAWEKRNFDPDNDGLYDAYASIWASDALYYNSGGVTHSSAYNYRANKMAADIAVKIGENPGPYQKEADKIINAINSQLWLNKKGWWAEYKDFMGNKTVHPDAAVWTVYHAIDSEIHTPFQAYQATRYVDNNIPQIPVLAKELDDDGYYTVSTTNWLPYSWSINNVALAEVAHTSLAYWQAGRYDEAYKLFKSSILDGMYLGSSPGNIGQVSFYDAARGECYRDFGDPVGVYSRVLIQGLFGIKPDLINNRLVIRPGFPKDWNNASVSTSDIDFVFSRENNVDKYNIKSHFNKSHDLTLLVKAFKEGVKNVYVNGRKQSWSLDDAVGYPLVNISCGLSQNYEIIIEWEKSDLKKTSYQQYGVSGQEWVFNSDYEIVKTFDPQGVLKNSEKGNNSLKGILSGELGHRILFVQLKQGKLIWWEPVNIELKEIVTVECDQENDTLQFTVKNNSNRVLNTDLLVNREVCPFLKKIKLNPDEVSEMIKIPQANSVFGTNRISVDENGKNIFEADLINWNIRNLSKDYDTINIDNYFNAKVTDIFKQEYLSPRSPYTTLQLPKQGIGEWCHPLHIADIEDSGLRNAVEDNILSSPFGIPFRTPSVSGKPNIAFTSLWDNYPNEITMPLSGKASHVYLMMAGSTNHMQCHIVNGIVIANYADGSKEVLELINPENWVPVEQDLFVDGYAFQTSTPRPYRVAFRTGIITRNLEKDFKIKHDEVYGRIIDGGAGVIVDLPLDVNKELKSLSVKSVANDVVIGLMSVTLLR